MEFLILLLIPLVSGSIDSFDESFIEPSVEEQRNYDDLLRKFLKLDIITKDVSEILTTFEKPKVITFPCNPEDLNDLVVNVIETRLAGFTVPQEHEGVAIVGGAYSWKCKITTSSKGIITMDCDNTLKLNPDVINPTEQKDPRAQEIDNLVILYHELLHGQLMLDAIDSSEEWRNDVCNKNPSDKIDYSYSDKEHVIVNPLQEDFTDKLVRQKGGAFFVVEIEPDKTNNGKFIQKIINRYDYPQFLDSGIKVVYRGINTNELSVTFPQYDVLISGSLKEKTKPGVLWVYAFEEENKTNENSTQIPPWIKNNAKWWSEGSINDVDFLNGIEYLVQNNILKIQQVQQNVDPYNEIPLWIKNNAKWWSSGLISDEDFISGIKYLIEAGIIAYQ